MTMGALRLIAKIWASLPSTSSSARAGSAFTSQTGRLSDHNTRTTTSGKSASGGGGASDTCPPLPDDSLNWLGNTYSVIRKLDVHTKKINSWNTTSINDVIF